MEQLESKSYPCKFIRSADPAGKMAYPLRIDPTKDFPQPLSTIKPLSFSVHHPHSTPPIPAVAACLSMETSIATVPRGSQRPPEAPQEPNPSPEPREDGRQRSTPTGSDNRPTSRQGHPARNQRTILQPRLGMEARVRTILRTMTIQQCRQVATTVTATQIPMSRWRPDDLPQRAARRGPRARARFALFPLQASRRVRTIRLL